MVVIYNSYKEWNVNTVEISDELVDQQTQIS